MVPVLSHGFGKAARTWIRTAGASGQVHACLGVVNAADGAWSSAKSLMLEALLDRMERPAPGSQTRELRCEIAEPHVKGSGQDDGYHIRWDVCACRINLGRGVAAGC